MSRRRHLGCLNKNNSSGSSEFIHHPDIAGFRQGWISLEQNPWTFVDTYRVGIFAIALLQFKYLVIRCTQSTFQHSWLEHLLLLKMHVHCLPWYLRNLCSLDDTWLKLKQRLPQIMGFEEGSFHHNVAKFWVIIKLTCQFENGRARSEQRSYW